MLKAKQSNGDVLFVYTNEEESARAARELRKQGYAKPIVGEATLIAQKTIELAGDAANGIQGHVALTADAPSPQMKAFDEKFQKAYNRKSDHNGIQGYTVPYIIKAVSEKLGKVDNKAFAAAMQGHAAVRQGPPRHPDGHEVRQGRRSRPVDLHRRDQGRQAGRHRDAAAAAPVLARATRDRLHVRTLPTENPMQQRFRSLAAALALAAAPLAASAQPVPIVGLVELSGTGATVGTNFDNGVKLAVKEINAAGGILGRKIEYTAVDTQTQPAASPRRSRRRRSTRAPTS